MKRTKARAECLHGIFVSAIEGGGCGTDSWAYTVYFYFRDARGSYSDRETVSASNEEEAAWAAEYILMLCGMNMRNLQRTEVFPC